MRSLSILYNSSGFLQIKYSDNATKKRVLKVLKKSVKKMEKMVENENDKSEHK